MPGKAIDHTGVLVVKNKAQAIPDLYLEKIVANNTSCMGLVFLDPAVPLKDQVVTFNEPVTLDSVKQMQESFKEFSMVGFFGNNSTGFHDDDVQPFTVLVNDSGAPTLLGFVEGEFTGMVHEGSDHSKAFWMMNEIIRPRAEMVYSLCDKDIEKTIAGLEHASISREFLSHFSRGSILLVSSTGKLLHFDKNDKMKKFDDWWTSNIYDYKEGSFPAEEEKSDDDKPMSMMDRIKAAKAKLTAAGVILTKDKPKPTLKLPDKVPQDTVVSQPATEVVMMRPPEAIRKNKNAVKDWYRAKAQDGKCPSDWHQFPAIAVKSDGAAKVGDTVVHKSKDTTTKHVPTIAATEPIKQVGATTIVPKTEPMPVMTDEGRKALLKEVLSKPDIVKSLEDVPFDPQNFQSLEDKLPNFAEQASIKGGMNATLNLTHEMRREMCRKAPDAAAILLTNYAGWIVKLMKQVPKQVQTEATVEQPQRKRVIQ